MISPDFSCIAKAYDLGYKKVESVNDIKSALEWSKNTQKSTIIEFVCDTEEVIYPMVPPGNTLSNMIKSKEDVAKK